MEVFTVTPRLRKPFIRLLQDLHNIGLYFLVRNPTAYTYESLDEESVMQERSYTFVAPKRLVKLLSTQYFKQTYIAHERYYNLGVSVTHSANLLPVPANTVRYVSEYRRPTLNECFITITTFRK